MHKTHRVFFLLGLVFVFALLFLFLVYQIKYKDFVPKPPVVDYRIAALDSTSQLGSFFYNFENATALPQITNEHAFSGEFAAKVVGKKQYSVLIQKPFSEFNFATLTEARLGVWVYLPANANHWKGKLMVQIVDARNRLKFSHAIAIYENAPKTNRWFYVSGKAEITNVKFDATDVVKVYYWNNCQREVFLDDLLLVLVNQKMKGTAPLINKTSTNFIYQPIANQPPYPTYFAENIFADKTINLYSPNRKDSLSIQEHDVLLTGNFIHSADKTSQILLIRNHIPYALIWFDENRRQLSFIKTDRKVFSSFPLQTPYMAADINGDGNDELIYRSGDSPCSQAFGFNSKTQKAVRITMEEPHIDHGFNNCYHFSIKNNPKESLIAINLQGEAFLLSFEKNTWSKKSLGYFANGNEINDESQMVCGNFIKETNQNNLLYLYRNLKTHQCVYKLFELNLKEGKNTCILQGNFDNKCDTLYAENSYFAADVDGNGIDELISYGSPWRFEMKLISFTNQGYTILGNIDFKGYEKDQNPKYYENLKLTAGYFSDSKTFSFFTLCKNNRNSADLPDKLGIYSLTNPQPIDAK